MEELMSNSDSQRYVVCYKWVVDEADIRIADDLSVDMSRARYKISDFDRSAIEAAMRACESSAANGVEAEVHALSFGGSEVSSSLKDALSRGPAEGWVIITDAAKTADGRVTAQALSAGIKAVGTVNCVFAAEGASDTYARQIPARIAALLDWPLISSVLDMHIDGDVLTATRKLDDCLQKVQTTLPAVVSVLPEGYEPRTPGLKAVMAAGRKPNHELKGDELGFDPDDTAEALLTPIRRDASLVGYAASRKNIIFKDMATAEAVASVASALRKEGVV
jgi:electron transfer flavoprotein beta subunit